MSTIVIKGGTVVTADGEAKADVRVVGEQIETVGPKHRWRARDRRFGQLTSSLAAWRELAEAGSPCKAESGGQK